MVPLDRASVPAPNLLLSTAVQREKSRAEVFYTLTHSQRSQRRFAFNPQHWDAGKELLQLSHNKCAYCESQLTSAGTNIDHYRPFRGIEGAERSEGVTGRDGYWWLTYEWENLYPACDVCVRNKHSQFPISGPRAAPLTFGPDLLREKPLLLDPCTDDAFLDLDFRSDGRVAPARAGNRERADTTIRILALNRPDLVFAREQTTAEMAAAFTKMPKPGFQFPLLLKMLAPDQPYLALRVRWLLRSSPDIIELLRAQLPWLKQIIDRGGLTKQVQPPPTTQSPVDQAAPDRATKAKTRTLKRVRKTKPQAAGFIRSIRIENFKAIKLLETRIPVDAGKTREGALKRGWKVILGENGAGKSSILQAVCLALMGQEFVRTYLREFRLKPADLLRKVRGRRRSSEGRIEILFSSGRKVVVLITAKKVTFLQPPPQSLFVRAYGATRLMPRRNVRSTPRHQKGTLRSATNLFDPRKPLLNVNRWLTTLKRPEFSSVALSLKDLLNLPSSPNISIEARQVMVPLNGLRHSLDELSAGYESIITMVAHIMAGISRGYADFQNATGIVILDEIDAHLHPRWKMRIVERLREVFPSMQFIVSTHEPLCLRGVRAKETLVVRRQEGEVICLDDLPAPSELRVDQLLTSDLFGLHTTIDPHLDEQFTQYYTLLGVPAEKLTVRQRRELAKLRQELPPVRMIQLLGDNRREQLIYEMIDEYLAGELVHRNDGSFDHLHQRMLQMNTGIKERIAGIWREAKRETPV